MGSTNSMRRSLGVVPAQPRRNWALATFDGLDQGAKRLSPRSLMHALGPVVSLYGLRGAGNEDRGIRMGRKLAVTAVTPWRLPGAS